MNRIPALLKEVKSFVISECIVLMAESYGVQQNGMVIALHLAWQSVPDNLKA
jgi:hypothetical protein